MVVTLILVLLLAGCGCPADASDWGPLAVGDSQEGGDALMHGTIRIADECVLLEEQSVEMLLVWPARQDAVGCHSSEHHVREF